MGEITFIRHGQASYQAVNYDKLSPLGHQQSAWLGQHLAASGQRFDRVICGSLRRHRETLAGIQTSLNHSDVTQDERLNEMSFSAMVQAFEAATGDTLPDDPACAADNFIRIMQAWCADEIPDVPETYNAFSTRIIAALRDHSQIGQHVLFISSGGPVGIIMRAALGLDLAATFNVILRTHNASYSRFVLREGQLEVVQYNGIAHLETAERRHALTFL